MGGGVNREFGSSSSSKCQKRKRQHTKRRGLFDTEVQSKGVLHTACICAVLCGAGLACF